MNWKDAPVSSWKDAPLVDTDIRNTVSQKISAPDVDFETAEKAKLTTFMQQKGYIADDMSIHYWKDEMFGKDSSYSAVNRELTNQLSVQPIGTKKSTAKSNRHDLVNMLYGPLGYVPSSVQKQSAQIRTETEARQKQNDELNLFKDVMGKIPYENFLSSVASVRYAPSSLLNIYASANMIIGDVTGLQYFKNTGRKALSMSKNTKKAVDDFFSSDVGIWDERSRSYRKSIFDPTTSEMARGSFAGMSTGMVGTIGGYATLGFAGAPVAMVGIVSDIHTGVKDTLLQYVDEEKASKIALPITAVATALQMTGLDKIIGGKFTPSSGVQKNIMAAIIKRVAQQAPASLWEASGETVEEGAPIWAGGGYKEFVKAIPTLIKVFASSYLITTVLGIHGQTRADVKMDSVRKSLEYSGFTPSSSAEMTGILFDQNLSENEREIQIQDIISKEENKRGFIDMLEKFDATFIGVAGEVDTSTEITGFNGGPLTTDDIVTLRNQPDLINDLDDSEESSLLKKAVLEDDKSALAEYNQRLVGTEEVQDAVQERETTKIPVGETPGAGEKMDGEVRIESPEAKEAQEITETKDEQVIEKLPEKDRPITEKTVDANGIPNAVGVSRALNEEWNEEWTGTLSDAGFSRADIVTHKETIQLAKDLGLDKRAAQIILKGLRDEQMSKEEIAALIIEKAHITKELKFIAERMKQADAEELSILQAEYDGRVDYGVTLSESVRRAETENARALSMLAAAMDANTFDLVNIYSKARRAKGKNLTEDEKAELKALSEELDSVDAKLIEEDKKKIGRESSVEITPKISDVVNQKNEFKKRLNFLKEGSEILAEVETATRRIKEKKSKGEDPLAEIRLLKKRQDRIFDIINEINRGKSGKAIIKKERNPDSSGYLEMIENLSKELRQKRTVRKLESDIAAMESAIDLAEKGDETELLKFVRAKKTTVEPKNITELRIRKRELQKEINRRIKDLEPRTIVSYISDAYDLFRNMKLTGDAAHIFRNGGIVFSNPKTWNKEQFGKFVVNSFLAFNEARANEIDYEIINMPNYELGKMAGLRIIQEGDRLDAREEILMKSIADKIPGVKGFGRMQITGVNLMRQMIFESYVAPYEGNITLEEAKDVAFTINILTGFGEYKSGAGFVDRTLNKIMISPRFRASRLQAPILLAMTRDGRKLRDNKILRDRYMQDSAWFLGTRAFVMYALDAIDDKFLGDNIKVITEKGHWAAGRLAIKTKNGYYRVYNPWAGTTAAYAFVRKATEKGFTEAITDSVESGAHPFLTLTAELIKGEDYSGDRVRRWELLARSAISISVEGSLESLSKETGMLDLFLSTTADVVGIDSILVSREDLFKKTAPKKYKPVRYEGIYDEFKR